MKKYVPFIIIGVVVAGGIGAFALTQLHTKNDATTTHETHTGAHEDSTKPSKKFADACKLFSKETLASTLGGSFGDGEEEYAPSSASPGSSDYEALKGSACTFKQADDGTTTGMTQSLSLAVAINNYKTADDAKRFMNDLHHPSTAEGQAAVNKPVDVQNVGDQAFFVKLKVASGVEDKTESLYARFGTQIVVLTATRLAGIDHAAMQADLTKLVQTL